MGQWVATSCTTGFGRGQDSTGASFAFTFGLSEEEALKEIERRVALSAHRPSLPTYDPKEKRREQGFSIGTGFFVSAEGHILTNYHVTEDANELEAVFPNRRRLRAYVVAKDPANDLALLKVEYASQPLQLKSTRDIKKATEVMTIGYPLIHIQGQAQKTTFGRINALSGVEDDIRYLQIDVPIQPGNSGGPLLTREGVVIGIVTATLDQVNAFKEAGALPQNVNYAVKADYIFPLLDSAGIRTAQQTERLGALDFSEVIERVEYSIVLIVAQ